MLSKMAAKIMAKAVEQVLKIEANSSSCIWEYEPKAPKALNRFKRNNKCRK